MMNTATSTLEVESQQILGAYNRIERTDIHRPSAIVPGDYKFIGFDYMETRGSIGACKFLAEQRNRIRKHMDETGGTYSQHEHGGSCHICGASAIYTVTFYHAKTNAYITTGYDCAEKMHMSYGDFNLFKKRITEARKNVAGRRKAQLILVDAGLSMAWDLFNADYDESFKYEENTARDIVGKLVKYGSISTNAMAHLVKCINTIPVRIARENALKAKIQAEKAAAASVPTGRVVIEGTILSCKLKSTPFGDQWKIFVKHVSGWTVYGTRPASLAGADRGSMVRFTATVEATPNDPKHGFFSRPTNGEVLPGISETDVLEFSAKELVN